MSMTAFLLSGHLVRADNNTRGQEMGLCQQLFQQEYNGLSETVVFAATVDTFDSR